MKTITMVASGLVTVALISYSFAIITEQRKKILSGRVLTFLTIGVALDIVSTILMILGSSKGGLTLHGFIGYSSLLGMSIDALLLWNLRRKAGLNVGVPRGLHLYSRYAWLWWVAAYITGGLLVAIR